MIADAGASVVDAWRRAVGGEHVLVGEAAARYGVDTSSLHRSIPAVVRPASADEVAEVVRIARRHKAPIHPVSTGRNWGYGTANPTRDGSAIVDLSRMRRIDVDEELGLATVEPGVTQRDLRAFLDEKQLPFLVPATGAGPDCSLLGNALERGYGLTPVADHFLALTALEAVLPDGERYVGALTAAGAPECDRAFKWGVGPYLDGLFAQGNLGVVTRATIALARRPERTLAFFFWVERDGDLERAVAAVREVLRAAGGAVGGINLMNDVRVVSMAVPYPHERVGAAGVLSPELVAEMARKVSTTAWMGVGAIYGAAGVVAATRRVVKRRLGPHVERLVFVDRTWVRRGLALLRRLPGRRAAELALTAHKMSQSLDLMAGEPSEVALPLAYWKSRRALPDGNLDPARDGCGLHWYAPLVPMRPEQVRAYVELVRRVCKEHRMDAPITLTSLSERAFDSTVPLLFARDDADEAARADACYRALFAAGRAEGMVPYRMGAGHMDLVVDGEAACWRLAARLKDAVDPDAIIAPGRYSLR